MTDSAHPLPDDAGSPPPGPSEHQPNWLVSPEQAAEDERRVAHDPLRLTTSNDLSESLPVDRPVAPVRPARPPDPERSTGPTSWSAAASSVPRLKIGPAPVRDGNADPALRAPKAKAVVTPMPVTRRPDRPVAPVENDSQSLELDDHEAGFDDETPEDRNFPSDFKAERKVLPIAPRKLEEPFWVVAMDELQSNPRVMILVGLGLALIVATWMFWPRSEKGISLHALRANPAHWDAQTVRLNGRVGEVFNVGAGWAYYLHQGRDTIVVFTRGTPPRTRDKISVTGSVSTGYLDGMPRQAIFATP